MARTRYARRSVQLHHTSRTRRLQLAQVDIPNEIPNTTAVFIVLRKMRGPLIALISIMTVGVIGLSLMPGVPQPDGGHGRLDAFEAFYVMTYTATTIGFGEIPHVFSIEQRWWIIFSIYAAVIGWAYALAKLMGLLQDSAFTTARAGQSFRRTISRLREPFTIIVGYGYIGRSVARALDQRHRRVVIIDRDTVPIERLATDLLSEETPGLTADARRPDILGIAGLNHPECQGVLALTGDDETNLQIVMTCSLLRPDVPVVARASTRRTSQSMADFKPTAIINPFDDYGEFLLLALEKPHSFRLLTWLSSDVEMELPPLPAPLSTRTWLIVADGQFGHEIASDLAQAGQKVIQAFPGEEFDLDAISGVVAGAESDTTNLALAAHIRSRKPDIYLAVRQQSHVHLPLLDAFKPDSIFFPPRLVVQRVLTNLISPRLWGFFETVMEESDEWAARATERIVARVGTETPRTDVITISAQQTPSVHRWLGHRRLELGTLFRSPLNAAEPIAGLPLLLIRGGKVTEFPADTIFLRPGDEIVMLGSPEAFDEQTEVLYDDSTLYYAATGHDIPTSQAWRRLTGQRWKDAFYG